jgi:hypothetical protein
VPKDWEVSLGVVGDEFFSFFPKIMDREGLLGTLGDAQIKLTANKNNIFFKLAISFNLC